ncbi:Hypothetical Protein FCC1311_082082 [Hondaea fermentalgiana]|uniref:Dynactin subunit 2 n=1 Tax=Hondaea fermentalgiana TaxID=2315210 RepID=A0A2R5GTK6_9STRA|nr:Hypothetical Protein FCC1311_082082 [Hondaea fermentalgiana]|eukprot:GBG31983.1 Hypothetical Protein FCC1311_082082 [Hondaea fermentalgiana]
MDGSWEVFETPDVEDAYDEDVRRSEPTATTSGGEDGARVDAAPAPEPERVFEVFAGKRFVVDRRKAQENEDQQVPRRRLAPEEVGSLLESPFERFNRLKAEVAELMNDLEIDEDDELGSEGGAHSDAYEQLANGVKTLKQSLMTLKGQQGLATLLSNQESSTEDRAAAQALNKARADALRQRLDRGQKELGNGDETSTTVSFDLLYAGDSAATSVDTEQPSALEARVRALEALLGDASSSSSGSQPQHQQQHHPRPLLQTVAYLENQVQLLDEAKLSHLTQKAKALNSELEESARLRQRRRAAGGEGEPSGSLATSEVSDVLRKLDNVDAVAGSLPGIVDRLRTAQEIHQHNANLHTRLDELDRVHAELDEAASLDRELLETLQKSLAENVERMQAHIDALQQ